MQCRTHYAALFTYVKKCFISDVSVTQQRNAGTHAHAINQTAIRWNRCREVEVYGHRTAATIRSIWELQNT